ncbi:MAG: chromosome segregation protein SMC [Oscillospiraceae bacterium]|nr:chromosome segregation protein SMC [Oscillospiraceae bacterium]
MVLKALEIQGFKSFPDRTKVTFDNGITAVVGPNGSGKSNISDAIRWVLGETSSKQLRGGGKMEDVIFGGTQKRSAMGFAAVNLIVDNTDRRVDVDNDEVIIGRKYYRSGESEYSINGQNVRLKDIYELFLDTGLGRDGYSIIGQGRISEIVGAKSNERREIFEEASGIARYRYRKNEAERRLASAEDNLLRLRDILSELEERVGPLERDSKKAKQFLELSDKRKSYEVTLWVDTIHKAKDSVRDQQRKIEIATQDYDRQSDEMDKLDADTAAVREEIQRMIVDIERLNAEIRAITEEASGCDAQIAVLNNDIAHNSESIANLTQELSESALGGEAIETEATAHKTAIAACEEEIAALLVRIQKTDALLEELLAKSAATGERRGVVAARIVELSTSITANKVSAAAAQSGAEAAKQRLATAATQSEENAAALAALHTEKAETDAFLQTTTDTLSRLENIKTGLSMKLESRKKLLAAADEKEQGIARAIESATQRAAMLQELEKNLDGFQSSVKTVIKAARDHRLRGILGPVSSILTVKSGYEIAIETALGFALQNVVVENESAAKAAMAMLRDEKAGRATFLPLDTMKGSYFDKSKLSGSAVCAAEVVSYDKRYENVVSNLLGRIIVVDDINEASRIARALDYHNRIVTQDGQVINAGGSFTGGSVSRSAGLFSRKQEIDDLRAEVAKLTKQRSEAEDATDTVKAEVNALTAELTATDSEAITAGGDKIRCEVELSRITAALANANATMQALDAERKGLEKQIADSAAAFEKAEQEMQTANAEVTLLETEMSAISGDDDGFNETRARLANELSDHKMQRLSLEKDIDLHKSALVSLAGRTGESAARRVAVQENLARLDALNAANTERIAAIQGAVAQSRAQIQQREEQIRETTQKRLAKEGEITGQTALVRQITDKREELSREVARLTERKTALETEYDQTIAKLWEEYELTLGDAQGLCVEFDTITELRRLVGEVRGRIKALGNVNVGAIEEYAEVSQRYEFMRTQVGDVEKSKAELEKMIAGLCTEMKAMFADSFANINKNFKRIFTELFGGGTAELTLTDTEDILESGIEIEVAPPGKIIKNLQSLSGGEQSLVAISIYFAILAVNPAPFCILDEIEAALDDVNVTRYAQYLRRITGHTQFIVITHRRGTMEEADVLYGVTMQEDGVSKLLKLDLANVDASLVS